MRYCITKMYNLNLGNGIDLLQILVTVDELSLVRVLELVGLDVLPQSLDDDGPGLCVDPQHPSETGVQLELRRLIVEHEQDGAADAHVSGSLHLETVRLLGRGRPVPLKRMRCILLNVCYSTSFLIERCLSIYIVFTLDNKH